VCVTFNSKTRKRLRCMFLLENCMQFCLRKYWHEPLFSTAKLRCLHDCTAGGVPGQVWVCRDRCMYPPPDIPMQNVDRFLLISLSSGVMCIDQLRLVTYGLRLLDQCNDRHLALDPPHDPQLLARRDEHAAQINKSYSSDQMVRPCWGFYFFMERLFLLGGSS
jgi:hypothetical protein